MRTRTALFLFGLVLGGCGDNDRGDAQPGDPCSTDMDCERGVCVGGIVGDAPACTPSCAGDQDCPDGWSCGAVTGAGVVVCRRGPSTPFGR